MTLRLLSLCAALVVAACGDNTSTPTVASNTTPAARLFFTQGGAALSAVDPSTGAVGTADAGSKISGVVSIPHGDYDAARKQLSRLHEHTIVYAKDAHLWKLSALSADRAAPVRLGTETGIGTAGVCQAFFAADYANAEHSRYAYQLAGMDNDCATPTDNVWKLLRLDQGTDGEPIVSTGNIAPPLAIVRDVDTGALTGWLRAIGNSLVHFDADYRHAVTMGALPAGWTYFATLNDGRVAFILDNSVRLYDPASYPQAGAGFSAPIYTFAGNRGATIGDGEYLYAVDDSNIVAMPLTGSGAAMVLATIAADSYVTALALTPTRLVYVSTQTINSGTATETSIASLKSVARNGGAPLTLTTAPADEYLTTSSNGLVTIGEWIYYVRGTGLPIDPSTFVRTAGLVRADGGSVTEYANAHWTGWQHADSAPLRAPRIPGRMLLFDSNTTPAAIWAFDNLAQRLPGPLGHAPSDVFQLYFTGYGSGSALLGRGQNANSVNDIFYIDMHKASSLARLTETAAIQETVVGGGCTAARTATPDASLALIVLFALGSLCTRRACIRRAIKKAGRQIAVRP